jgi:dolichol-phosphate mannosyltransferase
MRDQPTTAAEQTLVADRSVPLYRTTVFKPRQSVYAVCVFVLNEGDRIQRQLAAMHALQLDLDVIVADGGSTDGAVAPSYLAAHGVRALLVKTDAGALSAQMRMALSWCLDEGYAGIITIDGNAKDDVASIPLFSEALKAGVDHVQGSRYVAGGRGINTPLARHLGVRLLHAPLISAAAGTRYTDTTNGFRAYSRRLLLDPRVRPFRDVFVAYELHYYLAIRAGQLGFRVAEVPVTRSYPRSGIVPSKIRGFRGNMLVLQTLLRAVLGLYNPPD